MSSYIDVRSIAKVYTMGEVEIKAIDKLSFQINEGEFVVVVGASGAGKTTLLNLIGGMDTISSGEIIVDGRNLGKANRKELTDYRRNDVGFVFQFYNLVQNLTVLENVELAAQICKNPHPAIEMIEAVGLSQRLDNFPAQLSGGEQQRVAIARALAKNPKLLLCDEPTGALDYETGKRILDLLQQQAREEGMTTMLITHNAVIAGIADRVIRMRSGKISEDYYNERPKTVAELEW
ncbi:MAG: ABC transporter ATP-binding protein [Eubacteriales bacterium]|nr:ABC transporter ATP-binding protein [Eubacteriales bacterium]